MILLEMLLLRLDKQKPDYHVKRKILIVVGLCLLVVGYICYHNFLIQLQVPYPRGKGAFTKRWDGGTDRRTKW